MRFDDRNHCAALFVLVATSFLFAQARAQHQEPMVESWFLDAVHAPTGIQAPSSRQTLVIAIVDDGVLISHEALREFIWRNEKEIPANGIDDDGNGYVDDVHGWDVADDNNTVLPPSDRLDVFYHGTHLAGVVIQVARRVYGDGAIGRIEIMPVKALSDTADRTYLNDGYKGIEYAIQAGADIVLSAWSVGHISENELRILRQAHENGILIVGSAGNFAERSEMYPAAAADVLAVTALDEETRDAGRFNFGQFVDLAAPGTNIRSASTRSDTAYEIKEGTSQAAAIAAAAAAVVKLQNPELDWRQVTACLKQSVDPIVPSHPRFIATLGAGKLNLEAASQCELFNSRDLAAGRLQNPQGYLYYTRQLGKTASWTVAPEGDFKGLRFRPKALESGSATGRISFYAGSDASAPLVASHSMSELPESIYVAGTTAHIVFETPRARRSLKWLMDYKAEPIDFSRLYCSGTKKLDTEGSFDDGSGADDYAYHSDCKWLITAPEGKLVHITFPEFDTQAKIDKLYFFDGAGTHENIMATFSGPNIPPELTTWHNQVLVWFVTDTDVQGQGWRAHFRFVDPE
jgi:hypothetical protein